MLTESEFSYQCNMENVLCTTISIHKIHVLIGRVVNGGYEYYHSTGLVLLPWDAAHTFCRIDDDYSLASVLSEQENNFMAGLYDWYDM